MAVVEDEVRNDSEEENEIEVVVEEDDPEQDSDDSDDDDDDDAVGQKKVVELEQKILFNPYNYDMHIELIQGLCSLTELERFREAYDRLHRMFIIRPEHWLMILQTEDTLAHTEEARERMSKLFQQAVLDCYSIPIYSEWCSWLVGASDTTFAREQFEEVLHRTGPDPLSGKLFWNAKLELEKAELETMKEALGETEREKNAEFQAQKERVLWCFVETLSRPLLRGDEALAELEEYALTYLDDDRDQYLKKIKIKHQAAQDYLEKITPFEQKLLTIESPEEKYIVYQEYIDTVKVLSQQEKYSECDSTGILRVVYDRASTECASSAGVTSLLSGLARHARALCSRRTYARTLQLCTRRAPRTHVFWALQMQHAEHEEKSFDEVKEIFETALAKGMDSYKQTEALWLSYLEYTRRRTSFDKESEVARLRRTFRLAWDSLAEAWDEEANDCEVPLYWARLEYKLMNAPKKGKEIFEEIFSYGDNKTMSKYWEALIALETNRTPKLSENKLRELMRRALRSVQDYPPSIARLWTDYERDYGHLHTLRECLDACESKIKEWRESYQAMKDKMIGKKKGKQADKKTKLDKKKSNKEEVKEKKGKRKSDGNENESDVKRKKDDNMEVDSEKGDSGGVKRSHDDGDEDNDEVETPKRQRTDSTSPHRLGTRDACTLFVSNLEFKVDEQHLRDKLSQYGDIISLRVRKGIKAFGGSICYCQYKTPEAVDEALKHDRKPLDGRPMFFSRYSAKKNKPTFKYSTEAEKNKLFVKNLPFSKCNKDALGEIFDKYGKVKDIRVVTHKDGKPKGLAYIEYEEESSASEAVDKTHGMLLCERKLDVALSAPPPRIDGALTHATPALGLPKRDAGGGMRRTQLSSFIPSVLQRPSTSGVPRPSTSVADNGSQPTNGDQDSSNVDDKRPLSNSDFRSLLLQKK